MNEKEWNDYVQSWKEELDEYIKNITSPEIKSLLGLIKINDLKIMMLSNVVGTLEKKVNEQEKIIKEISKSLE